MPRLKAAIDEVCDQVSPRSNLYIVPDPMSSRTLEVKCTHCPWWDWTRNAALADVLRNFSFNHTLGAVKMHVQSSSYTNALNLDPAPGKSGASGVKTELSPPISRKKKPSQQLTAETIKCIRSATHEPQAPIVSSHPLSSARLTHPEISISSSSTTQPPSSPEETSESALLAACRKWFPKKTSDIQKVFVKYTADDIDCGECEDVFEKIAESGAYMASIAGLSCQHVLDHMLGSNVKPAMKDPRVQPPQSLAPATNDAKQSLKPSTQHHPSPSSATSATKSASPAMIVRGHYRAGRV
ncbi:hypothetical protein IFR05_008928 [Cadophora sp. M221]|nr:hypothetical protein IFR05_008928 [Cadophora sp. M221]